jgi:hypothetical protein
MSWYWNGLATGKGSLHVKVTAGSGVVVRGNSWNPFTGGAKSEKEEDMQSRLVCE